VENRVNVGKKVAIMFEFEGDIFEQTANAICIPTNYDLNKYGYAIMGKGLALETQLRYPWVKTQLGKVMKKKGQKVHIIPTWSKLPWVLVSFPTKLHYFVESSLKIIRKSANELVDLTDEYKWTRVALPRVGCGLGRRNWEKEVKPILSEILDNRFAVFTLPKSGEKHK